MLRKIKLHGKLAEFVGHKEFEAEVSSVGNAVSFLLNNFPQLERHMSPNYYQVKVGDYDIDETEVHHPVGREDIHFVPVIAGAGRGGTGPQLRGNGVNNSGSGGGGGSGQGNPQVGNNGGAGGSGVVLIRYQAPPE